MKTGRLGLEMEKGIVKGLGEGGSRWGWSNVLEVASVAEVILGS
jgi:hypothetical protein